MTDEELRIEDKKYEIRAEVHRLKKEISTLQFKKQAFTNLRKDPSKFSL